MKLILNCDTDNEFAEGMDFAFLDLTPEMASLILRRKASFEALKASDDDLSEPSFHHCGPLYFSDSNLPEERRDWYESLTDIPQGEAFRECDQQISDEDFENIADRSECDRMVINHDSVWFECYQKHCDPRTETHPIKFEIVQRAAMEVPAHA